MILGVYFQFIKGLNQFKDKADLTLSRHLLEKMPIVETLSKPFTKQKGK